MESNAYLLAKIGFDTTENEPCKVCPIERPDRQALLLQSEQMASRVMINAIGTHTQ